MAKLHADNKRVTAINTPLIQLNRDIFGFETELAERVDVIIEEIEKYLFEGKKAQLELFAEGEGSGEMRVAI